MEPDERLQLVKRGICIAALHRNFPSFARCAEDFTLDMLLAVYFDRSSSMSPAQHRAAFAQELRWWRCRRELEDDAMEHILQLGSRVLRGHKCWDEFVLAVCRVKRLPERRHPGAFVVSYH